MERAGGGEPVLTRAGPDKASLNRGHWAERKEAWEVATNVTGETHGRRREQRVQRP